MCEPQADRSTPHGGGSAAWLAGLVSAAACLALVHTSPADAYWTGDCASRALLAERLRETGQEYGASTGRPRRCGWYDAVVVRYSARINGMDAIALTKLDVLDGLPEVRLCVGYKTSAGVVTEFPADLPEVGRLALVGKR